MTMKKNIARDFNDKIESLIPKDEERDNLYTSLKEYQSSHDLLVFLRALRTTINEPERIEIYDYIRPLVPLKHQLLYDSLTPSKPGAKLRSMHLRCNPGESLGFAIRGGLEHNTGIYVSYVLPDSQAFQQGLRVGDEIVWLNGFLVNQAIHDEVVSLVQTCDELTLKVRHVGMIPVREHVKDKVTWRYIESLDHKRAKYVVLNGNARKSSYSDFSEVKVFVNVGPTSGLGCSISSGPVELPGIFVQAVRLGSLAQEVGLQVGDQIVEVNGTSFLDISHAEAVYSLKASKQLHLTVRKGAGLALFESSVPETPVSSSTEKEKELHLQQLFCMKEEKNVEMNDHNGIITREIQEGTTRKSNDIGSSSEEKKLSSDTPESVHTDGTARNNLQKIWGSTCDKGHLMYKSKEHKGGKSIHTECQAGAQAVDTSFGHQSSKAPNLQNTKEKEVIERLEGLTTSGQQKRESSQTVMKQLQEKRSLGTQDEQHTDVEEVRARMQQKEDQLRTVLSSQQAEEWQRQNQLKEARFLQETAELQRERQHQASGTAKNSWIPPPTHLHGQKPTRLQPLQVATYMTSEKKPSFRIQKPVLLSPLPRTSDTDYPKPTLLERNSIPEEAEDIYMDIDEANQNNPCMMFTNEEIAGRQLKVIDLKKDGPLDMSIEMRDTPLKGLYVSEIFAGGTVHRHGGIVCGDQILMIEDTSLADASLSEAHNILTSALKSNKPVLRMYIAKTPIPQREEQITYL